jgi:hypothetical protein
MPVSGGSPLQAAENHVSEKPTIRTIGLLSVVGECIGDHVVTENRTLSRNSALLDIRQLGLAAGIPLTLLAVRPLKSMLYGITPFDPASLALAIAALAVVSGCAALAPARRAASVEPMEALRTEWPMRTDQSASVQVSAARTVNCCQHANAHRSVRIRLDFWQVAG